jgi:hypothetical protein
MSLDRTSRRASRRPAAAGSAVRALAFGALCLSACFVPVSEGPPAGYERTYEGCRNRFDDDGDRLVDCRDPDCIRQGFCNRRVPLVPTREPENTPERCSDLIDNDDDGRFDCGDSDCFVMLELCCSLEFDDITCTNGVDDDGNGFTDCQDSGCSRNPFVTVCESETSCENNLDDDGDRRPDCFDTDCERSAHCVEGGEDSCTNGADEDGDGRADCDDRDCYGDPVCSGPETTLARCVDGNNNDGNDTGAPDFTPLLDCTEPTCMALPGGDGVAFRAYCMNLMGAETSLARCQDGVDNDGNGFTDCSDFSCSRGTPDVVAYCESLAENTLERCMNGLDDDGNGFIDCRDFSCTMASRGATPEAIAYCMMATGEETSLAACMDGRDNDGNGFTDCADFSCTMMDRGASAEAIAYCADLAENTLADCTDGVDNDNNGFTDCNDFSCSRADDEEVVRHCATFGERSFALCTDGIDNDGNGFPDCQDFSCREVLEEIVDDMDQPTGRRRSPCLESVGADDPNMRANCMDGVDNDRDGFADCDDWDCNWNPVTQDLCLFGDTGRPRICG